MKLSSDINLEPLRQLATDQVNARFFEHVQRQAFYDVKFEWAKADPAPSALIQEAELKGISVQDLRDMIISKHNEANDELMRAEVQRQRDNLAIKAAKSEQELKRRLA